MRRAVLAMAVLLAAAVPLACGIKAPPLPPLPEGVDAGSGAPAAPLGTIGTPLDGGPAAASPAAAGADAGGQPSRRGADGGSAQPDAGRP